MGRKTLSSVDTAWLRMEDPTNLMMISGVMVFGAPMDYDLLKAVIQARLLRFDRFRQRVVRPAFGMPYWEDDPNLDLDYHLQRASLPPPGDQAALQDLASFLASRQLDPGRALWQFHLVEKYGDGCALICRLHHCIGDGLALVYVLLSMTDTGPDTHLRAARPISASRPEREPLADLARPVRAACQASLQAAGVLAGQCQKMREDPDHAANLARTGIRATGAAIRLVGLWPDPKTILKGELDVPKRAAWTAPLHLRDVKTVGKALGGTVNDVLLTAMSGALRRYLLDRDQRVDGLNFRAVIPVNLRKPGAEEELGNQFGLVFLALPVGIADPSARLHELKRRMDGLKDSMEAPVAFGILTAIGSVPEPVQDLVVDIFGLKGTAVMTNVMGPPIPLYLAGTPLESLMFWVPQSGHLGLGVSILSYAGRVWMGIITDEGLVPDPETIVDAFHAEFDGLMAVAQGPREGWPVVAERLDETLASVDALLEARKTAPTAPANEPAPGASPTPERCQALTQAGTRCKNQPLPGSDRCRVHQAR